ncbi:effector-associated constant component EACC1 [Streptomyces cyslabdanicus]|uniref:effector-associated constant component EACC1 n=1 Tax=Streptomyces cyslabdanicus TaxID=1470456 RepID=UPI004043CFC7
MGEVWIGVGRAGSAGSLAGWLRRDPGVARSGVEIAPVGALQPQAPAGSMGAVDTVTALVDSTVGLVGLLVAVAAWRRPHGTPPPTVRVTESDGTLLEGTPEDVLRVLRARREQGQAQAHDLDDRRAPEQGDV